MPEINKTGKKWRPGNRGGGVVAAMGVEWAWLEARTLLAAKVILKGLEEALKVDLGEVSKGQGEVKGQEEVNKAQEEVNLDRPMEEAGAVEIMEIKGAEEAEAVEMELKAAIEEAGALVKIAMEAN